MSQPLTVNLESCVDVVGIRLRPHAIPALTGYPAAELRDATPDLTGRRPARLHNAFLRLAGKPFDEESARALVSDCAALIASNHRHPAAPRITDALLAARGHIATAARVLGLCPRQFQRVTQKELGLSPKLLGRILRVQTTLPALIRGRSDLALVAATSGFSDQAHMTREFATLTGYPPAFWRSRRMSDSFNTHAVHERHIEAA